MEFINVYEDSYPLYELCRKEGWTTSKTYDEWFENDGELSFFEGDPDVIKINGVTGYFCRLNNVVFYYFDNFYGNAEKMLRKFFDSKMTGITLGCESFCYGPNPWGVTDITENHLETFKEIQTGIAYRGGAGYSYYVSDWTKYYNRYIK